MTVDLPACMIALADHRGLVVVYLAHGLIRTIMGKKRDRGRNPCPILKDNEPKGIRKPIKSVRLVSSPPIQPNSIDL